MFLLTGNLFGASKHRQDSNAQQLALLRDKDQSEDTTQQVRRTNSVSGVLTSLTFSGSSIGRLNFLISQLFF